MEKNVAIVSFFLLTFLVLFSFLLFFTYFFLCFSAYLSFFVGRDGVDGCDDIGRILQIPFS